MRGARIVGIDLGTTNTLAAYADGRIPRILPTEGGHGLLPSIVAFREDGLLVGHAAKEQLLLRPRQTVYGSKRLVGRPFYSTQVQAMRSSFAWPVVRGEDGLAAAEVGGRVRALGEISSILLSHVGRWSAASLGGALDGVVVTVPAYYPLSQREAVRRAAKDAGLDVWRLVNEPTAAALAYGVGRNVEQRVLVFDLGGGTLDVSVLEISGGAYQVKATGGDGFLGGVDFDLRLCEHLVERFEDETGASLREDVALVQRVLGAAEQAKQDLSLLQHVEVRVPWALERRGRLVDLVAHVDRATLVSLTEDLVERAARKVVDVLAGVGLGPDDVDEVLLAGGQTRMPAVQARLERLFSRPPRRGLNPDEVVAQGAALLARSLGTSDHIRLLDVVGVPTGVSARLPSGAVRFVEVLPRDATLPAEASVTVSTWQDGQTALPVDVFQGAGSTLAERDYLGTVLVEDLPAAPAGESRATLWLSIDAEGLLVVAVERGARRVRLPVVAAAPTLDGPPPPAPTRPPEGPARPVPLLQRLFRRR